MRELGLSLDGRVALLGSAPALAALPERVRRHLARSPLFEYEAAEPVLRYGDAAEHVYVLLSGAVRVFYSGARGRRALAKLFAAPAFFGEMEVLARLPRRESVETLNRSRLLVIGGQTFRDLLIEHAELAQMLLIDVAARLCIAAAQERSLAFDSVQQRLATLLLAYARVFGTNVAGGIQLGVELTQEALAADLGTARKSVQRALDDLRAAGTLELRGRHYVICDNDQLEALSGTSAPKLDYRLR